MIYGLSKPSHTKERRITVLLLLVYAIIAAVLFYNEQRRENVAEGSGHRLAAPQGSTQPGTSPS